MEVTPVPPSIPEALRALKSIIFEGWNHSKRLPMMKKIAVSQMQMSIQLHKIRIIISRVVLNVK